MDVSLWVWAAVIGAILVMLAIDLVAHRDAHVISVKEAAAWSAVWVALGVGFGALLWWWQGPDIGQQYFAGYLIEKSLAVDNVFVWAVIFSYFTVPPQFQQTQLGGVGLALGVEQFQAAAGLQQIEQFRDVRGPVARMRTARALPLAAPDQEACVGEQQARRLPRARPRAGGGEGAARGRAQASARIM